MFSVAPSSCRLLCPPPSVGADTRPLSLILHECLGHYDWYNFPFTVGFAPTVNDFTIIWSRVEVTASSCKDSEGP